MKKRFDINLDDSAFTKERPPPKPQFQSSSMGAQNTSKPGSEAGDPPLSYAAFIVHSKTNVSSAAQTEGPSTLPRTEGSTADLKQTESASLSSSTGERETLQDFPKTTGSEPEMVQASERTQESRTNQKERSIPKTGTHPSLAAGPSPVGSGSSIVVSPRQRGNPILKFVRSVPWEFGDVVPDYVLGPTTCALFLSLRYHSLNPNYIHDRLKTLGKSFTLRVLLVQVDVKDPHHALKELAQISIRADCTLILSWSPEEAGRYLETYKSYEKKPADILKEQIEKDYLSKVTDCLTTVKSINRTDAITLLSIFSSLEGIIGASKEDLVLCPGLGPQKARRLHDVLHKPFLKSKTNSG
ncbi:DNA excision repair protein ERCC-1 [Brachionichthys hirsutus]|uniref:DNA excision repair protein ERCC-1 n=1 Tax=Brachionichthys hirsutus TaxID=412623 RepID=UPI00360482A7